MTQEAIALLLAAELGAEGLGVDYDLVLVAYNRWRLVDILLVHD